MSNSRKLRQVTTRFPSTERGKRNKTAAKALLYQARHEVEEGKRNEVMAVDQCRVAGISWAGIGHILGVTGSAAFQRFRAHVRY